MRINLDHPFDTKSGRTIQSVTLRRAKGKDMVVIADLLPMLEKLKADADGGASGMDGKVVSAIITMVSTIGDVPYADAEEIDFADLVKIANNIGDFLGGAPSTGAA